MSKESYIESIQNAARQKAIEAHNKALEAKKEATKIASELQSRSKRKRDDYDTENTNIIENNIPPSNSALGPLSSPPTTKQFEVNLFGLITIDLGSFFDNSQTPPTKKQRINQSHPEEKPYSPNSDNEKKQQIITALQTGKSVPIHNENDTTNNSQLVARFTSPKTKSPPKKQKSTTIPPFSSPPPIAGNHLAMPPNHQENKPLNRAQSIPGKPPKQTSRRDSSRSFSHSNSLFTGPKLQKFLHKFREESNRPPAFNNVYNNDGSFYLDGEVLKPYKLDGFGRPIEWRADPEIRAIERLFRCIENVASTKLREG